MHSLKRRFQQNQNDCVFTVLSLLPTLGDQILHEMNIEKDWAKLQESRKLEKIELRLKKEREQADLLREEQEAMEQLQEGSVVLVEQPDQEKTENKEDEEKPVQVQNLESSTSSLATSIQLEEDRPLPAGILDKKEKHLLWEEIKSKSKVCLKNEKKRKLHSMLCIGFTRSLTSIYSVTLLTLLTHIQLNLLGRFTYVWSVSVLNKSEPTIRLQQEGEEPDVGFLDPQVERMFLSASWWILHRGWKACTKRVQEAVDEIVASIPLKSSLDYHDAEVLLHKLRQRIEYDDVGKPIK